jgi:3-methyladenine DNA glycosylase Mpg
LIDGNLIGLKLPEAELPQFDIITGRRIGVDYAGLDAELPYRFFINKPELSFNP